MKFFTLALFVICAVAHGTAFSQEIRVLHSDVRSCTIEYRPLVQTRSIVMVDGNAGTACTFDKGVIALGDRPGTPDVRLRTELLVLPGLEGHAVTVLQADYETRHNVIPAPIPSWIGFTDSDEMTYAPGQAYTLPGWFPESVASLLNVGIGRDRIIGDLRIAPVQWELSSRSARFYSRLLIRIDYGAPDALLTTGARRTDSFDIQALNAGIAEQWTLRQPSSMKKTQSSPMATGSWYRIEVSEEGMYRLNRSWFQAAGIDVSGLDPRTIRIYGYGGRELPVTLSQNNIDELPEVAIEVSGESDGRFDDGDYVVFYAKGPTGFSYEPISRKYTHYLHRYDKSNAYLLTFGGQNGKRIQPQASRSESNPYVPQWFHAHSFVEDENVNLLSSGKLWLGKKLTPGTAGNRVDYTRKLEGLVPTQPIVYRMMLYSQADRGTSNSFTVKEDQATLGIIPMPTIDLGTDQNDIAATPGVKEFVGSGNLPDSRSVVSFTYSSDNTERNRGGYVDWLEWHYARQFLASSDVLAFSGPDTTATIEYGVNGFTNSDVSVFDVTNPLEVKRIMGPNISGGTVRFQVASTLGSPGRFALAASGALKVPPTPTRVNNSNLRDPSASAEFIILTSDDFVPTANKLKTQRERPGDPISTRVVSVTEVYNEFSSSVIDPTAIRNFIAYAMKHWTVKPRHVLLFGDAHFDYRNYTTNEKIIVPAWESENSIELVGTYPTDDYYVMVVGNDTRIDLGIGRLPVQTVQEAEDVVAKIIEYESGSDFDPWRNRVTFVADDGITTRGDDWNTHTKQSEDLAVKLVPSIEQRKIYIVSYPTENTTQGRRKPEAARDIVDQINDGTVVINYTGHGSEVVWAHEQVLTSEVTIPQLKNAKRMTFVIAATCTFGLYDRPGLKSGTELFISKPDGGAIGGLSSPRLVYSGDNSVFNSVFIDALVNKGRNANGEVKRIGEAIYASKQILYGNIGFEKFHLFCDPAIRLAFPRHHALVEAISINGQSVSGDTIQLRALSKVTVEASIRKPDSSLWQDFNGTSLVTLFDATRSVAVPEWNNYSYSVAGGILYRGQATITNGRFTISFIVPKDISYENTNGRFTMYFDNMQIDGTGFSTAFRIGGSDSTADRDDTGPEVQLFMDSRSFHPGDLVNEHALLIADLFDEHGINTTGIGIGHDIEAWLDNSETSISLNEYYKGESNSYQRGTVEYRLKNLTPGRHVLRLRAWDIYNNSSTAETQFVVAESNRLSLANVYNVPNPLVDRTVFTFQHNLSDPVNIEVKIYTVSGRLIHTIEQRNVFERYNSIPWDGTDSDGDRLANGIYFYKVVCSTTDGSRASEALGKLSVLK